MQIPAFANQLIGLLWDSGFQGYVVGGCVRDSLLGRIPHDWDICTDATPEQMYEVFRKFRVFNTGVKHGTITVLDDENVAYEVTTFRTEGGYSDNRHPDSVDFVSDFRADAARRDFTINAMAYSERSGLIDYFGGKQDIKLRLIRCVGDPDARFQEDALRIFRALRFSSVYGFDIEVETAAAIHRNASLLEHVSAERIRDELCKLLAGSNVLQVLLDYSDVISVIIPEMRPCIGFEQHNRYHQYTVYDHIAHAVANYTGGDSVVNVALLLHDIGKPECYTEDERGGHFYGHGTPSARIAEEVVRRLRFSREEQEEIVELVREHDSVIEPQPKVVRRWLNRIGEDRFRQLLDIRLADILAHAEGTQESRIERRNALKAILEDVIAERQCFSMKDLAVNGNDIMRELGIGPGKRVGEILRHLLDAVIAGELPNSWDALISEAKSSNI